ncbi:MAG TPA: hypothetical protein VEL03_20875, partial [Streptosporangiaceae bacterium]|nr:hypothetical protein [Streptosporangiaceae bacterium]
MRTGRTPAHASGENRRPGARGPALAAHVAATAQRGPALAAHVAGMMPWGPLLAGCLTGICMTVALRIAAGPTETPADLTVGVRASFVPVIAGLAFLLHDPHRPLTGALPARAWLTPAVRVAMAIPALALSGAVQLQIAGRALAADLHATGQPAAPLPWVGLTAELAAWCALALALAAGLERTRWHDLAGLIAAVGALAVIGAVALVPLHLLPVTITAMTSA